MRFQKLNPKNQLYYGEHGFLHIQCNILSLSFSSSLSPAAPPGAPRRRKRSALARGVLIWRSSSFLFCRRGGHFLPPVGWGSSGPPFLDLSKRSRFLSDFWTDFWSIFRRHKGAQHCQNIDFASTNGILLVIFYIKTRDFCAAFCKKPMFSQ